jgi:hypothetical protein
MTPFQSTILISCGIFAYILAADSNVSDYLILVFKLMNINIQRFLWMLKYHPNNFITTYFQNRKYDKIARELEKELTSKTNS